MPNWSLIYYSVTGGGRKAIRIHEIGERRTLHHAIRLEVRFAEWDHTDYIAVLDGEHSVEVAKLIAERLGLPLVLGDGRVIEPTTVESVG